MRFRSGWIPRLDCLLILPAGIRSARFPLSKVILTLLLAIAIPHAAHAQSLPFAQTGDLYISHVAAEWRTVILDIRDLNSAIIKANTPSPRTYGIAFDAAGNLYAVGGDGLNVFDTELNLLGNSGLPDPDSQFLNFVAVRKPGQVFACNPVRFTTTRLFVFDTSDLQRPFLAKIVPIPLAPAMHAECRGLAFDSAGFLWVSIGGEIVKIELDAAGDPIGAQAFLPGGNVLSMAFQPGTGRLFYTAVNSNFVGVVEPDNASVRIATISQVCDTPSNSPGDLAFSSSGDLVVGCANYDGATADLIGFPSARLQDLAGNVDASSLGKVRIEIGLPGGGFLAFKPIAMLTPAQAIADLMVLVASFQLHHGIANSLDTKLQAALDALNGGNPVGAVSALQDFVNEVEAQSGKKKLTTAQADQLIAAAQRIIAVL
jgi:hypothetical protein